MPADIRRTCGTMESFMSDCVMTTIRRHGVIPVIAIESVDDALPLADALIEGGLPIAEITFRTSAAADAIAMLAKKRPELLVGAGTVLTLDNLNAAINCGAAFGVAPGTNPEIICEALDAEWPFVPGVATPSDVECGLSLGCQTLKFFPAGAMGGPAMLKALAGPLQAHGCELRTDWRSKCRQSGRLSEP
jgi:2-dehydro-3-deoxyphosphogluconate aldolase/(4S)-4-hydroxy-2-oxoglutarate aldolase